MIFLERAHKNIQDIFTLGWAEDDMYATLIESISGLPSVAIQCIGALLDTDSVPVRTPEYQLEELTLQEFIALVENKEGIKPLAHNEMETAIPTIESLTNIELKKRIIRTVYVALAGQETAVVNELLRRLEVITDGHLDFGDEVHTLLYRKIFLLLTFRYAEFMPPARFIGIYSSSLFTLALFMEIMMIPALEAHIRYYSVLEIREGMSLDYAASIASNEAIFGVNKDAKGFTIKEWIEHWNTTLANVSQADFFSALEKDEHLNANETAMQPLIEMVAYIYRLLISGYFMLEPGSKKSVDKLAAQLQKEERQELITRQERPFPEQLAEHTGDLANWIGLTSSLQALLEWLRTFASQEAGHAALITLLQQHVPDIAEDTTTATALLQIDGFLKQQGFPGKDIVFFDEQEGVFKLS
ncbi:MAG: hypothetical protein COU33_01305 [Candidatus Magasanikbacteria bacterium CG10_big_fil_rev_8_21_14_0_10_43_6]|uniref:Uncharacterized protein n=1 Tax=Candidatus Magasanikbacteria bacterium CG10_big_fil_rev_8_21_14_0_10_43_6 TaxID=1974650 RepID=A0A2M6W217_9BACT|nr:MAG: hypothetical protein COU33_01305 [Candidatus Magasanikbacteria bacterium CG10_big_fil_rev_8_21_14_0_10_43_6]